MERPPLDRKLDSAKFREFYWLKEELVLFCRNNGIPSAGSKMELAERISLFLDGRMPVTKASPKHPRKMSVTDDTITTESLIEPGFVCSEKHRAFFRELIGKSFTFNVAFQKWLKSNAGKTYADAIAAYYEIKAKNKTEKTTIGSQFEYNTYIRDFFAANKDKSLDDAIRCWKHKKSLPGHNRYEEKDLEVL